MFTVETIDSLFFFFFFNDTATTEIYTLSLHDALPICEERLAPLGVAGVYHGDVGCLERVGEHGDFHTLSRDDRQRDRKSTRLNSSHSQISYAVFCLKKKKNTTNHLS